MLEETRRPAHGLAGIVDDVVEPRQTLDQEPCEQFDARSMPQIETVDLQAPAEGRKIGLPGVAVGGIDGKTRGDDDVRTGLEGA